MRRVRQLHTLAEWAVCQASMGQLLSRYAPILLDDAQRTGDPVLDVRRLLNNLISALPWVWVLVDDTPTVWAIAALTDVQPGRHAFLHGVSHPALRGDGGVEQTLLPVLQTAFGPLGLLKLKAEFEADNPGAKGFCHRLGFQREALFPADIQVQGRLRDVAVCALSASRYQALVLPQLLKRLQRRYARLLNPHLSRPIPVKHPQGGQPLCP